MEMFDRTINEQIQELFLTMEEGWLVKLTKAFQGIESFLLMHGIIRQLENTNNVWKCENVKDTICELHGIYRQKHHKKGEEKLTKLIFPVESYVEIKKD